MMSSSDEAWSIVSVPKVVGDREVWGVKMDLVCLLQALPSLILVKGTEFRTYNHANQVLLEPHTNQVLLEPAGKAITSA